MIYVSVGSIETVLMHSALVVDDLSGLGKSLSLMQIIWVLFIDMSTSSLHIVTT